MSLTLQILQLSELDELSNFESDKLKLEMPDEVERNFASWQARWRKESLEHYLPLGWSFIARHDGKIVGYFIAQALLFLDGQTQSLWVEHMQFVDQTTCDALVELAYRLSREKHLQKVYLPDQVSIQKSAQMFKSEPWSPAMVQLRTTRT